MSSRPNPAAPENSAISFYIQEINIVHSYIISEYDTPKSGIRPINCAPEM